MRASWVTVDLGAIASNVGSLARLVEPARLCAVVKADGYGHGDVPVAEVALGAGAERLAVAMIEEGVRLREAGIESPILLLSEPPVSSVAEIVRWRLTPTVYTEALCDGFASAGLSAYPVHIKVDTGMHRVGADPKDALRLAERVTSDPAISLEGVWTHFPVADSDSDYTSAQITRFKGFLGDMRARGIEPDLVHAANTPGTLFFPESHFDMVRAGLGIYGLLPSDKPAPGIELRPAMSVHSEVVFVKHYEAGTRLSYGLSRPLPADGWVATVPVGYADGISRRYGEVGGQVLISERRLDLAGTVTMDQIVVDLGPHPVEVGEEVTLIGRQGTQEIPADEWAQRLGTINYEIVCRIGPRMPRRFVT